MRNKDNGKVVFLSFLFFVYSQDVPVPIMVDTIVQIKKEIHAQCLYVIYNSDVAGKGIPVYKNNSEVLYLSKLLYQKELQMAILSQYEVYHPTCNKPLYVIPYMDMAITYLESSKIPSVCQISRNWLLFLPKGTNIQKLFFRVYIPFNCEFMIALRISEVEVSLFEVYHTAVSQSLQIRNWTEGFGLYARRNNLDRALIRVTAVDGVAVKILHDANEITVGDYFGQVWKCLKNYLNYSDEIHVPPDNSYGNMNNAGNWTGMIGMITKNEADVAVADIVMNPVRVSVMDFIAPLLNQKSVMIININNHHVKWNSYLLPFSCLLWTAVAVMIILTAFCHYTLDCIRYHYGETPCYSWQNSVLLLTFGSFCLQGHPFSPQSISCRIVFFMLYFTSTIFSAAYSAYLISFLTSYSPSLPFNTFEEFLNNGNYKLSVTANTAHLSYFKSSSDALMKRIYTEKIAPHEENLPEYTHDGIRRVCDESFYAYMAPDFFVLRMMPYLHCHITIVPRAFIPGTVAMAISKNSPYLESMRFIIHKMHNMGILKRIQLRTLNLKLPQPATTLQSVTTIEVTPLYLLLILNIVIAISLMVLERICKFKEGKCKIQL